MLEGRVDERCGRIRTPVRIRQVGVGAFAAWPAVVATRPHLRVDLLVASTSDVADPEVVRLAIDRDAEGIAETVREDLRRSASCLERVAVRDPVRFAALGSVDIDPEDLGEEAGRRLTTPERVVLAAAVTERGVEETILAEREAASLVIRLAVLIEKEDGLVAREALAAVGARDVAERGAHRACRRIVRRPAHIDAAVLDELRVKGHTEEAPLAIRRDAEPGESRERCARVRCVRGAGRQEGHDRAAPLRDVPRAAVARSLRDHHRGPELDVREDALELRAPRARRARDDLARRVDGSRVEPELGTYGRRPPGRPGLHSTGGNRGRCVACVVVRGTRDCGAHETDHRRPAKKPAAEHPPTIDAARSEVRDERAMCLAGIFRLPADAPAAKAREKG